jgi:hypothetical protein
MVVDLESIQIQTLQNVIRFQDELLQSDLRDGGDIACAWKNECYRLLARKEIAEEEAVRLGLQSVMLLRDQREYISKSLKEAMDSAMRDVSKRVCQRIDTCDKRLRDVEKRFRRMQRKLDALQDPETSVLSVENVHLSRRNRDLEDQVKFLQSQLTQRESEIGRLVKMIEDSRTVICTPSPAVSKRDAVVTASPGTSNEVNLLLDELKALEAEARQMLIKS